MRLETDEVAPSKHFVDVFEQNGHLKCFCLWSPPTPIHELSSQSEDSLWPLPGFLSRIVNVNFVNVVNTPNQVREYEAARDIESRAKTHMECIIWHPQSAIQGRRLMMNVLSPRDIEFILKNKFKQAF